MRPWLTKHEPPTRPAARPARLAWRPNDAPPIFWTDTAGGGDRVALSRFSAALRHAGLVDTRVNGLPGGTVVLPAGMALLHGFGAIVRRHYAAAGLREYDYPMLAPLAALERFDSVFPSAERVLYAGTRQDFAHDRPAALLLPTGEPAIYSHWRELVEHAADLPIEMFRQTRFLRPWSDRAGAGIFSALEGADTFEFHGCYTPQRASEAGARLFAMLRGLAAELGVPVLWSTRPPWSNHHQVSHATIGGDALLPSGASLQVATLYDQRDIFSQAFGIVYRDASGARRHPHHVVGALSRRLLLVLLLIGLRRDGSLFLGPRLHPAPIELIVRPTACDSAEALLGVAATLRGRGWATAAVVAESGKQLAQILRARAGLVAPLILIVQGRRDAAEAIRVVLRRGDDHSETVLLEGSPDAIAGAAGAALDDIEDARAERLDRYARARLVAVESSGEARDVLAERNVALAPLCFEAGAVAEVAGWQRGEVLGFVGGGGARRCLLTGRPTDLLAYISPRA